MGKWSTWCVVLAAMIGIVSCSSDDEPPPIAPDTTAPAAITDLRVLTTTGLSVTLRWTAPGDDGETGTATEYSVRFATSTITPGNWNTATPVSQPIPTPSPAGTDETIVIVIDARLSSGTSVEDYYFAVRARDDADNWSGLSNVVTETLGDATPPAAITDLTVTGTTDSSVYLQWTAPGDDDDVGTASAYDIRFSNIPITMENWSTRALVGNRPSPLPAGTQHSMEVFIASGLSSPLTRYIAIRATDEANNMADISNVVVATINDGGGGR